MTGTTSAIPFPLPAFDTLENVGVQLTVDINERLIISTFSGEINDADLLGSTSLIRSHPDFDPSFSDIVDFSGVTAGHISTSTVQNLSGSASIFNPTSMHVVIAPHDLVFGLARMAQVFAEKTKPNIVVVRTIEEAREFLRLKKTGLD
jgi:hypothetical protein